MKKICVITGTRAEYGLLKPLIKKISQDKELQLQLIVTGMHLSPEFGLTYKEIESDEFNIDEKVEILLSSDTSVGISKSMGLAIISFSETYERLKPDIIIVLGDRYEIFAAVSASTIARIPVAHLHGGETTEGAFDEAFRHCITKMSYLHFTSTEEYRQRVIQLGENPSRVFNVGAIGIESIKSINLLSKEEFEKSINFKLGKMTALVTFHPVTLENNTSENQFKNLLDVLDEVPDLKIIFTKSNSDTNGRIINKMIYDYVEKNKNKAVAFDSLGQLRYLSAMKYIDVVVGNSSSGIIEAPSFSIPTVNIGDRQKGRIQGRTIINCNSTKKEIYDSLLKALSLGFKEKIKDNINPYGHGNVSDKILCQIKKSLNHGIDLKKIFYDFKR
ncbi:UDP-N-acetylglucosamine 2-epimerase (hydrolyzing) [Alkaliphilus sp. MSJ-5]|uniref:UDP-N-acetylglucosamine 2-epimerase (Hydrolyzing) n=1 Tax=Alkaliphilus flagellatus TaxID=2841507 RepID=A0ABS6G5L6_9FIRM|nr:UDP-N-acetylglucosamine 2-epimerase [Alkaliphilus flagellatus]MBU5676666.1 UDP-N-acetylglucosamine 2-epimerase (hydrolyzing) [Alkaliphilus flagellatus]